MQRDRGRRFESEGPLGSSGRPAFQAGLELAFDAAVRFGVTRIPAEPRPDHAPDSVALLAVADGVPAAAAKDGMLWVLNAPSAV